MGRRIPWDPNPITHPALSLALVAAWIAAIIAVVTALCGARSRKTSSPPPPPRSSPERAAENSDAVITKMTTKSLVPPPPLPSLPISITTSTASQKSKETSGLFPRVREQQPIPITPKAKDQQFHNHLSDSTSKKKLIVSLSMKLTRVALPGRYRSQQQQQQRKQEKWKPEEDSIWKKTIILGEKCRVPNGDDSIIYDDKGNRVAAYPVRMPRSLPVSRTNSYIDQDALPF